MALIDHAIFDSADSLDRIEQLMIKLTSSTEKLSKSSDGLERYTKILISLTVLLLFFTVALLIIPPETPSIEKYLGIVIPFIFVLYWFSPNKIH